MWTLTNSAKLIDKIKNIKATWVETTQPSNPTTGSTYYDTTNNVLMVYDWTQWNAVWWWGWWSWWWNYLDEIYTVWELYSLSDDVFRQDTPILSNCTRELPFWDDSSRTQVHIQRIWSWTASNQLKLKLKKYWDPETNVIVEVREWIKVNESSSSAYRYWSNIICSWSIPYSSISTSWWEITVTMDWTFWWTKWQLLDVVVYKASWTSSTTNYYAVMFDNTQYSECFSAVYVNWNTRARTKIAPYCISTWFLTSNMAKVKTTSWSFTQSVAMIATSWWWWDATYNVFTAPKTWNYTVKIRVRNTNYSWWTSWQLQWMNSTVSWNTYAYEWDSSWWVWIDCVVNVTAWVTITIKMQRWSYWSWWWDQASATFEEYWDVWIMPSWEWTSYFILRPRTIENIWNDVSCTLYWEHVDWVYKWWVMLKTATTATSWSISTSNFVWYIVVNLNWNLVKIPYYNM
jgi:hypothetical protein